MSNIFDKYYKEYDAWYDRNVFAYLSELKAVKKVMPQKNKGLEIGVGTGRFAAPLGIKYGIDPSKNMVKIARARGVKVKVGCGEHLPFEDAAFDYAAIIVTLCFVKNPLKVLGEARRVLNKNGNIIIGIIDKGSFLGRFYKRKKIAFYKKAVFHSVREVTNLLKDTGFDKFSYYQTIFKSPGKLTSIENPQKGYGRGGFVVIRARKSKFFE